MNKIDIVVIGDAFIDIFVPTDNFIPGGVFQGNIEIAPGGLATTAVWASRLNTMTGFAGKIGKDVFGQMFQEDLIKENVLPFLSYSDKTTGKCISLIHENKDRTMLIDRGANDELKREDIPLDVVKKAEYIYLSGYSFGSQNLQKEVVSIIKQIKDMGRKIVFNAGAYNITEDNGQLFKNTINRFVDILILNKKEAEVLTGEKKMVEIQESLKSMVPSFIVTMGAKGSIAFDGDDVIETGINPVHDIVDTTGAGDAFAGGFLAGMIKGKTFEDSILDGHGIAKKVVTRIGAR